MASRLKRPKVWTSKQIEAKAERVLGKILKLIASEYLILLRPEVIARNAGSLQVSVRCVSSAKMKALNFSFRKKNQDTDVLSFEAPVVFIVQGVLGDLVVSKTKLQLQAIEYGHSLSTELEILLVHGVLHLLGMDHELGAKEAQKMARWEKKILTRISANKAPARSLIGRN